MIEAIRLLWEWRLAVLWIVVVGAAWWIGGWRLAVAVGSLGALSVVYQRGQEAARRRVEERTRRQRDAYEDITDRGVTDDDVTRDLRDGRF